MWEHRQVEVVFLSLRKVSRKCRSFSIVNNLRLRTNFLVWWQVSVCSKQPLNSRVKQSFKWWRNEIKWTIVRWVLLSNPLPIINPLGTPLMVSSLWPNLASSTLRREPPRLMLLSGVTVETRRRVRVQATSAKRHNSQHLLMAGWADKKRRRWSLQGLHRIIGTALQVTYRRCYS
jgi:hypothetical protein